MSLFEASPDDWFDSEKIIWSEYNTEKPDHKEKQESSEKTEDSRRIIISCVIVV